MVKCKLKRNSSLFSSTRTSKGLRTSLLELDKQRGWIIQAFLTGLRSPGEKCVWYLRLGKQRHDPNILFLDHSRYILIQHYVIKKIMYFNSIVICLFWWLCFTRKQQHQFSFRCTRWCIVITFSIALQHAHHLMKKNYWLFKFVLSS